MTDYHPIVYIHYFFLTHPSRNGHCWGPEYWLGSAAMSMDDLAFCSLGSCTQGQDSWVTWQFYFPFSGASTNYTNALMCEFSILLMGSICYLFIDYLSVLLFVYWLFICFVICHQHLLTFHPMTTGMRRCLIAVLMCISLVSHQDGGLL